MRELKERIIKQSKEEKDYQRGFKQVGDLVEEYLLKRFPDKWEKLPLTHPTGFDFYDEEFDCFTDIKACRATEFNNNIFIEYIQNTNNNILSNHWKIKMDDDSGYYLFYFDTSEKGFGKWWLFDWRELRKELEGYNKNIKGGYYALGSVVSASKLCKMSGRLGEEIVGSLNASQEA
mgnify:FL=1